MLFSSCRIMKLILGIILTLSCVFAHRNTDEFINEINSKQNSWTAGRNFYNGQPITQMPTIPFEKFFLENIPNNPVIIHDEDVEIPESFDARTNWPKCKNIGIVLDQGPCVGCWAISVASVASDRVCIHSDGKLQPMLSAHQLLTCEPKSRGCLGGFHFYAWDYWKNHGLVTGGPYNSTLGCQPYTFAPCEHHFHGSKPDCPYKPSQTPKCQETCSNSSIKYEDDLIKGGQVYYLPPGNRTQMQLEIMKNGPITGWMILYEDIIYYKSGVYHRTEDASIGVHTIRIIGWGVENGTDYWLVVNSWNEDWGDKGLIKVRRGNNECGIERYNVVGLPE